jgi:hypothetical protein
MPLIGVELHTTKKYLTLLHEVIYCFNGDINPSVG